MTETNAKWKITERYKIILKLKDLGRNLELIFIDSKVCSITNSDWLLGRMLNTIWRKVVGII